MLEMSNSREPDSGKSGSGWEERQGLTPDDSGQAPEEAQGIARAGSLASVAESPKQAREQASSHAISTPRTPSRFYFGRSSSLQEGSKAPTGSRGSQRGNIFGSWRRNGQYSAVADQVMIFSCSTTMIKHEQVVIKFWLCAQLQSELDTALARQGFCMWTQLA